MLSIGEFLLSVYQCQDGTDFSNNINVEALSLGDLPVNRHANLPAFRRPILTPLCGVEIRA